MHALISSVCLICPFIRSLVTKHLLSGSYVSKYGFNTAIQWFQSSLSLEMMVILVGFNRPMQDTRVSDSRALAWGSRIYAY